MPYNTDHNKLYTCFVCDNDYQSDEVEYHNQVNLPICKSCEGTPQAHSKAQKLLDELADGFVCGCI